MKKVILLTLFIFLFFAPSLAAQQEQVLVDLDDDGIMDNLDPEVFVSLDKTLDAGLYYFNELVIASNTNLYLRSDPNISEGHQGVTIVAEKLIVHTDGKISSNKRGFSSGSGSPGSGRDGGSYGGNGVASDGIDRRYGSALNPLEVGSGSTGRKAGGAIKIIINGALINNGTISSDGDFHSSGGSLNIEADRFSGVGKLSATGGMGAWGNIYYSNPGGGGRIAVRYNESTFTGTTDVSGGQRRTCSYCSTSYAESGTVVFLDKDDDTLVLVGVFRFQENDSPFKFAKINTKTGSGAVCDPGVEIEADYIDMDGGQINLTNSGLFRADELDLDLGSNLVLPGGDTLNIETINLKNQSQLTVAKGKILDIVADDVSIESESKINLNGTGYKNGAGPGFSVTGAGSSHGGLGEGSGAHLISPVYGSAIEPTDMGSGGIDKASGGGALKLRVNNTFINNGKVSANASAGDGASGGSIFVIASRIEGDGEFSVNGGNARGYLYDTGAGAGGRIALHYEDMQWTGSAFATRGNRYVGGPSQRTYYAQDGTIVYVDILNNSLHIHDGVKLNGDEPDLEFDNIFIDGGGLHLDEGVNIKTENIFLKKGSIQLASTSLDIETMELDESSLYFYEDQPLILSRIDVLSGSKVSSVPEIPVKIIASKINIDHNSKVYVRAMGYKAGPGYGEALSGSGYGGRGGLYSNIEGGAIYGSETEPSDFGSGKFEGRGGGVVYLEASDELVINGEINADGGGNSTSGGSVHIVTKSLSGAGNINAKGATAWHNSGKGSGGGGGGRVAVYYESSDYSGGVFVNGGAGLRGIHYGHPGTSYWEQKDYVSQFDQCSDEEDNDNDGLTDSEDPGCVNGSVENSAPVINFIGRDPALVKVHALHDYREYIVSAYDDEDGDITDQVVISVDGEVVPTGLWAASEDRLYDIHYDLVDSHGARAKTIEQKVVAAFINGDIDDLVPKKTIKEDNDRFQLRVCNQDQEIDPDLPTIVMTHGLQNRYIKNEDGEEEDIEFEEAYNGLWSACDGEKKAGELIASIASSDIDKVNLLSFTWKDAFTDSLAPDRDAYIQARTHVYDAGMRLSSKLLKALNSDNNYNKEIHFIGHSLGTAVNTYAARDFLYEADNVSNAQFSILDFPSNIDDRGFLGFFGIDEVSDGDEKKFGFDVSFFESLLPIEKDGLTLKIDNYWTESAEGVGAPITGPVSSVYNHFADFDGDDQHGLEQSIDVGGRYFSFENKFGYDNDHSGVQQWYRYSIDPNGIDEGTCLGYYWNKPLTFDESLNPCMKGWSWAINNTRNTDIGLWANAFPQNESHVELEKNEISMLNIEKVAVSVGCSYDGDIVFGDNRKIACVEKSSPFIVFDVVIEENVNSISFDYKISSSTESDSFSVLIDNETIWTVSGASVRQEEWINTGAIPVSAYIGERRLSIALFGEDEAGAVMEVKNLNTSVFRVSDTESPESIIYLSGDHLGGDDYLSELSFSIEASDNFGVKNTSYSFDGLDWIDYEGVVTVIEEGEYIASYKSEDLFGNIEETKIKSFRVISARGLLETVIASLESRDDQKSFKNTMKQLEQVLDSRYWSSDNLLSSLGGRSINAHLRNALRMLERAESVSQEIADISLAMKIVESQIVATNGNRSSGGSAVASKKILEDSIHVSKIKKNSAQINWRTSFFANSRVVYSMESDETILDRADPPNYGYTYISIGDDKKATGHQTKLKNLEPGTSYNFRVISGTAPELISEEYSFKTRGKKDDVKVLGIEHVFSDGMESLYGLDKYLTDQLSLQEAEEIFASTFDIVTESSVLEIYENIILNKDFGEDNKNIILYFISRGTQTTIRLGAGERAGVLESYYETYGHFPQSISEWQDVIKIASGRWPGRLLENDKPGVLDRFTRVYKRAQRHDDIFDRSAIQIMNYGLRPVKRNLSTEKNAINTFVSIYGHEPKDSSDWDTVRSIAYSGCER